MIVCWPDGNGFIGDNDVDFGDGDDMDDDDYAHKSWPSLQRPNWGFTGYNSFPWPGGALPHNGTKVHIMQCSRKIALHDSIALQCIICTKIAKLFLCMFALLLTVYIMQCDCYRNTLPYFALLCKMQSDRSHWSALFCSALRSAIQCNILQWIDQVAGNRLVPQIRGSIFPAILGQSVEE